MNKPETPPSSPPYATVQQRTHEKQVAVLGEQFQKTIQLSPKKLPNDLTIHNSDETPLITDLASVDKHLGGICSKLFQTLTSQQLEATYQRCLEIDLTEAGVTVLAAEVSIDLVYKGRRVGTRRADIVFETPVDKKQVILELKAVSNSLSSGHLKQIEFYMHHFEINTGYLINFPHDSGFPDVSCVSRGQENTTHFFRTKVISGDIVGLSDRSVRCRNKDAAVQIVKVERIKTTFGGSNPADFVTSAASPCIPSDSPGSGNAYFATYDASPSSL